MQPEIAVGDEIIFDRLPAAGEKRIDIALDQHGPNRLAVGGVWKRVNHRAHRIFAQTRPRAATGIVLALRPRRSALRLPEIGAIASVNRTAAQPPPISRDSKSVAKGARFRRSGRSRQRQRRYSAS